jgi:hypothetical protein
MWGALVVAYRQDNSAEHRWRLWKQQHAVALARSGIPEIVLENERVWLHYLEHGGYDWFKTEDLSPDQMATLYELLTSHLLQAHRSSARDVLQRLKRLRCVRGSGLNRLGPDAEGG